MAKTMFLFLLTCPAILLATPIASDPAAVAADPAAAAVPVAAASPAVEQAVAAPPPPAAAAAPVADVVDPAAGTKNLGTGYVTETKNPDGSTITITRYNGPLPASALAPFSAGPFFSPFFGGYGGGYPFYPGGYGHQPYGKAA